MNQDEILKKAQAGTLTKEETEKYVEEQKKAAYKKAAKGTIIGMITGFLTNLAYKFFNKK